MTGYPGMPDSVVNAMNAAVPSAAMTTPGGVDPFDPFAIEQPSSTADNTISGPGMGNSNALGPRGSGPRASQGKGGGRGVAKGSGVNKRRKAAGEDTLHPEVRFAKEKERRVSNNTLESTLSTFFCSPLIHESKRVQFLVISGINARDPKEYHCNNQVKIVQWGKLHFLLFMSRPYQERS